ncbi:MAG: hypothetical protein GY953_17950 [bacterium]|nr:hypothetical protein [bacterium]
MPPGGLNNPYLRRERPEPPAQMVPRDPAIAANMGTMVYPAVGERTAGQVAPAPALETSP